MLFHPDMLAGRMPATLVQVQELARKALLANREAGKGFAVCEVTLDGYGDWARRRDQAFADGLFQALLQELLAEEPRVVCGWRVRERAVVYLQGLSPNDLSFLGKRWCQRAQGTSLAARGGPDRLTVGVGGAHLLGFRQGGPPSELADLEHAAHRGARLVARTGGNQFAMIERFGPCPLLDAPTGEVESRSTGQIPDAAASAPGNHNAVPAAKLPESERESESAWPADLEQVLAARYGEAFEKLLEGRDSDWKKRIYLLEKRLEKLGQLVDLAAHSSDRPQAESGLASRFQTVQGLRDSDEQFESKQGLMSAIYLANLEIRQRINGRTAG